MHDENRLKFARAHSFANRREIEASRHCGCFRCLARFPASEVDQWWEESSGAETAVCPRCGIGSVLGDAALPIDEELLRAMEARYFGLLD